MQTKPNYSQWFEKVYPELTGQGLWLRGGEINTLNPSEYFERDFRVLFTRLSTYFDTGYSFTHQFLYQVAANTPGVFPDLAYLPPRADLAHFEAGQVPWLLGTQTKFEASSFDLIGFSNSIVQELINLPHFLKESGIPLKKSQRLERADLPLIIMGGANALYSSCVTLGDPLVDGVFVGESDLALRRILEIARDGKKQGFSKRQILDQLEEVPGFIQPEKTRQPEKKGAQSKKAFIPNLNQSEALENGPVYYLEDQLGNSHLQISEGCPCFCSFCAESWDRKPYRERNARNLREVALRAKAAMGLDHIDIYSFNFNMHSELYQILWDLVPNFKGIGLKSQRFDLLAHDPQMVEFQHALEKASLTCGLEGISPRLRKYLHKNLENEQLHASLAAIFKSKARELKVFLIATGLEEEQDFAALGDLIDHLREVQKNAHSGMRIIFSMTPLVRFPWTPLEFEDGYSIEHYQKIIEKTGACVRNAGFEFRESADLPEYWVSQVLVRADREEITQALVTAVAKSGFIYYRDVSENFRRVLEQQLIAQGLDPVALLKGFTLEESAGKPWTAIDTSVKREFLWEEVLRAREYKEIDYCLGRSWTQAKCFHCGGCPTRYHVRDIVLSQQKRGYSLDQFKERIRVARTSETEVTFSVSVGEAGRGVPRKMVAVALSRALMLTDRELTAHYRGFKTSSWLDEDRGVWITGDETIALMFDRVALPRLESRMQDAVFVAAVNARLGDWAQVSVGGLSLAGTPVGVENFEIEIHSQFALKPDAYLKTLGLKYTYRKSGDGVSVYEFIPQSIKKGIIKKLEARSDSTSIRVSLTPGPKFVLRDFLMRAFAFSRPTDWARLRVTSISRIDSRPTLRQVSHSLEISPL